MGYDELGNSVYSVPVASIKEVNCTDCEVVSLQKKYFIAQPGSEKNYSLSFKISQQYYKKLLQGDLVKERVHFIDSYSSFLSNASFTVIPIKCWPGFRFDNGQCVCDTGINGVVRYVYMHSKLFSITCSKLTIETLEQGVKYVQS